MNPCMYPLCIIITKVELIMLMSFQLADLSSLYMKKFENLSHYVCKAVYALFVVHMRHSIIHAAMAGTWNLLLIQWFATPSCKTTSLPLLSIFCAKIFHGPFISQILSTLLPNCLCLEALIFWNVQPSSQTRIMEDEHLVTLENSKTDRILSSQSILTIKP